MTPQPQPADRCPARLGAPGYLALAATVDEAATKPGPIRADSEGLESHAA